MQQTAVKSILIVLCMLLNTIMVGASIYYFITIGRQRSGKEKTENIRIWVIVFVYSIINVMAVLIT